MYKQIILFLVIIICTFPSAECYKILVLFGYSGHSHFLVIEPLLKSLSAKGHELTVISHFPQETLIPRYTDISLVDLSPSDGVDLGLSLGVRKSRIRNYLDPVWFSSNMNESCIKAFQKDLIKKFLKTPQHFDLVITELFGADCLLALNEKIRAPSIGVTTTPIMPWHFDRFGMSDNPSYVPTMFLDYSDRISFFGRVENTLVSVFHKVWFAMFVTKGIDDSVFKKYLNNENIDVNQFVYNMSLFFVNTHFTVNWPRSLPPNVVEIGGLHLEPPKPLPKNIEKFINESSHGVIYFSLGSMIKGHTFPEEKREQFLKAFARLPQRVLWKWENETMPGKPDNVMIQQWMPQFDILCHPNVKAFISHGGLLGTTEAVHCGVPMIVMPQYGDQHTNARAVEANGGGVIMDLEDATEEKVYDALKTILSPEFNAKTKELSARFRDRPMSPMDTAIYWVEYVARHKGAPHMRTAAVGMPLYQYLLLDVIAFIVFVITVFLLLTFYTLRSIFRLLFRKKEKSEQTNKSKVLQNKKNK